MLPFPFHSTEYACIPVQPLTHNVVATLAKQIMMKIDGERMFDWVASLRENAEMNTEGEGADLLAELVKTEKYFQRWHSSRLIQLILDRKDIGVIS